MDELILRNIEKTIKTPFNVITQFFSDEKHRIPHPKFMITYFLLLYLHPKKILLFLQVNLFDYLPSLYRLTT